MKRKRTDKSAIQFYKEIQADEDKYRLVNGLFIVKYLDDEFSYYYGDFLKSGSATNKKKTNLVKIQPRLILKYSKKRMMATTNLGFWKPLRIGFIETSIKEILK
jgi:hypothetical protein